MSHLIFGEKYFLCFLKTIDNFSFFFHESNLLKVKNVIKLCKKINLILLSIKLHVVCYLMYYYCNNCIFVNNISKFLLIIKHKFVIIFT